MSQLLLDVRVVSTPEPLGQQVAAATRLLQAGDRVGAERGYGEVLAARPRHPMTWINLSALAVGLGEAAAARAHAERALSADPRSVDAWVNFGVASWHANQRRDAARAMHHALSLAPGLETAALNLAMMFRAVQQLEQARDVLASALEQDPERTRLQQELAGVCRLLGDTDAVRRHALAALTCLMPTLVPTPGGEEGPEPENDDAQRKLLQAMTETVGRLEAAGIDYHLVGGVVLGIVRQGRPFAGDKDVDIGLPFDVDRKQVAALFAHGYTRMQVPDADAAERWCLGFMHDATGVGVDLFFKQPLDGVLRICLGWPDDLYFDLPQYRIGSLDWQGRAWRVPVPLDEYLAADYGDHWRSPTREVQGHAYDKRWHDSQVSSPSLAVESIPRALNLGLLRLLVALGEQRWPKALALCDQLLARQPMPEVHRMREVLLNAGIG